MDTITQAMLGAVIGQAGFARSLGPRARVFGALGGLLPDLDVVAVATHGPYGELLYHRGVTHSLWFGFVLGPVLALAVQRGYVARGREPAGALGAWSALFVLALVTHPLVDWCTPYGTQLLAPFSDRRFALNGVGIIDVFYSLPLAFALAAGFARTLSARARAQLAGIALALTSAYMLYAANLNASLERALAAQLRSEVGATVRVRAYPTLLQPWLRRVVARADDRVRIGWVHTSAPGDVRWQEFALASDPRIEALASTPEGRLFSWFAMDDVAGRVREVEDGAVVELDDLRYGVPGDPRLGMWGVRGFFDRSGTLRSAVERFSRPRSADALDPAMLVRAAFGDLNSLR